MSLITSVIVLTVCVFCVANCDLSVLRQKQCGQTVCNELEYCSSADNICRKCSSICDPASHNLHEEECKYQCQDFLHDSRYQRKLDSEEDIYNEVRRLYTISTLALTISSLALLGLLVIASVMYLHITNKLDKLRKKKMAKERIKIDYVNHNARLDSRNKMSEPVKQTKPADVAVTMPTDAPAVNNTSLSDPQTPRTEYTTVSTISGKTVGDTNTPTSATINSTNKQTPPLSSRHPSEDNTLDYAYDNPGLTPSPTFHQPPGIK